MIILGFVAVGLLFVYFMTIELMEHLETRGEAQAATLTVILEESRDTRAELISHWEKAFTHAQDERSDLLNRIKPETYQPLPSMAREFPLAPTAVTWDQDDEWTESRDETVARMEREMAERMRSHEEQIVPEHMKAA